MRDYVFEKEKGKHIRNPWKWIDKKKKIVVSAGELIGELEKAFKI